MGNSTTSEKLPSGHDEKLAELLGSVKANPRDFAARECLITELVARGKLGAAQTHALAALRFAPNHLAFLGIANALADRHKRNAERLHRAGKTNEAIAALNFALALKPANDLDILNRIGVLYREEKKADPAILAWREAMTRQPASPAPFMNLAKFYEELGQTESAMTVYREAIEALPAHFPAYFKLAGLLFHDGQLAQSREIYERVLAIKPAMPEALAGVAMALERENKIQEAYARLAPLIENGTSNTNVITSFATVCQRLNPPDTAAVALLEHQLKRAIPDREKRQVLWALAQLCNSLGRHGKAFPYLLKAKALQVEATGESTHELLGVIERTLRCYTPERMGWLPRGSQNSHVPVFVIGMPRSGTTLTEQILSSHPRVHGAGELTDMIALSRRHLETRLPYPACLDGLTQERIDYLASRHLAKLQGMAPQALRVVDKMPFNFIHLGMIELLFPKARVIHCTRHPLDTCVSVFFNRFSDKLSITQDLAVLGTYYRRYRELMAHWRRTLKLPVLTLNYEALVRDPEPHIRRLIEFCGLDWDPACERFYESKRVPKTFSYHQVRKPINASSVGRYKDYESFLGPLKEALGPELDMAG